MTDLYRKQFTVYTKDVPICRRLMNGVWVNFQSRIVSVVDCGETSIIVVQTKGRFPFVTNRWDKYIIKPGEIAAPASVYGSLPKENTVAVQPFPKAPQLPPTPLIDRLEKEVNASMEKPKRGRKTGWRKKK